MNLIEYFCPEISVVSFHPCVGPSPRIEIYIFLLSTCTYELISTAKVVAFLQNPLAIEKVPRLSSPIPYHEYFYLSTSAFFTNLTPSNKQFSDVE